MKRLFPILVLPLCLASMAISCGDTVLANYGTSYSNSSSLTAGTDGLLYPSLSSSASENLRYTTLTTTGAYNSDATTWGTLNCHDPQLFEDDDGTWYCFSTDASIGNSWNGGIQIRKSTDKIHWTCLADPAIPNGYWNRDFLEWEGFTIASETTTGCTTSYATGDSGASVWAPCVIKLNGKYYMYYGMNADITSGVAKGKAHAYIGLAVADKVTGPYKHIAKIVRSTTLTGDTTTTTNDTTLCTNTSYGCIDPSIVLDANGDMWMNYGSWRTGIAIMRLDNETGLPLVGDTDTAKSYGTHIAGANSAGYEGSQVFYYGGYYYIFISSGALALDYSVRVGRSDTIDGHYYDENGFDLTTVTYTAGSKNFHYHGSKILGSYVMGDELSWRSPGGVSLLDSDGKLFMAVHTRTNWTYGYFFYLQVRQVFFTDNGWPIVNPNEYAGEELQPVTMAEVAGTYDAVMTVRTSTYGSWYDNIYQAGDTTYGVGGTTVNVADATPTASESVVLGSDGSVSGGNYTGTWSISDNYKITINLCDTSGNAIDTYQGVVVTGYDWSREKFTSTYARTTISFTTMGTGTTQASGQGEYFFGNLHNF